MFCSNCGAPLGDQDKFCKVCGTPVSVQPAAPQPAPAVQQPVPQPAPVYQQPVTAAPQPAPVYQQPVAAAPQPAPALANAKGGPRRACFVVGLITCILLAMA